MNPVNPAPPPRGYARLPLDRPRVTYLLLGLIGLAFLAQLGSEALLGGDLVAVLGAKVNELIIAGEWWRLITPILVHGGLLHFFFNAYALYNLGREVEATHGPLRFTLLFLFSGVAGTALSFVMEPLPSVGASGAIFGLIGAEGVLLYRNRALLGGRARAGLRSILFIVGLNLLLGLQSNIDNWGHLGGLIGGAGLAWFIGPRWQVPEVEVFAADVVAVNTPVTLADRQALQGARWLALPVGLAGLLMVIAAGVLRWR